MPCRRSAGHRAVAPVAAAALLSGCVSARQQQVGADDGMDACRAQVVAIDSTAAAPGDVRSLAASNIARRENFSEAISAASRAVSGGAFELVG